MKKQIYNYIWSIEDNLELFELSKSENIDTRIAVAMNKNTTSYILTHLSMDENWEVKYHVAKHKNTTPFALNFLSEEEDHDVLWNVVENENTGPFALLKLSRNKNGFIQHLAKKHPNFILFKTAEEEI
jgi:flagellar motor switch protein FliG